MAAHMLDWGDPLNKRHGGANGHHGDDVCGGSCVDAQQNYCIIPTVGNLRGGSFLFSPEPL